MRTFATIFVLCVGFMTAQGMGVERMEGFGLHDISKTDDGMGSKPDEGMGSKTDQDKVGDLALDKGKYEKLKNKGKDFIKDRAEKVTGKLDESHCGKKVLEMGSDFFELVNKQMSKQESKEVRDNELKNNGDLSGCLTEMGFPAATWEDAEEAASALEEISRAMKKVVPKKMFKVVEGYKNAAGEYKNAAGKALNFNDITNALASDETVGAVVTKLLNEAGDETGQKVALTELLDRGAREGITAVFRDETADDPLLNTLDEAKKAKYIEKCTRAVMGGRSFLMPTVCREALDTKLQKEYTNNEKLIRGEKELVDKTGSTTGEKKLKDEDARKKKKKAVAEEAELVLTEVAEGCKIEGGDKAEEGECGKMLPHCACLTEKAAEEGLGINHQQCKVFKAKQCGGSVKESDNSCLFNVASTDSTNFLLKAPDGAGDLIKDALKSKLASGVEELEFMVDEDANSPKGALNVEVKDHRKGDSNKIMCTEDGEPESPHIIEAIKKAIKVVAANRRRLTGAAEDDSVAVTVLPKEEVVEDPQDGNPDLWNEETMTDCGGHCGTGTECLAVDTAGHKKCVATYHGAMEACKEQRNQTATGGGDWSFTCGHVGDTCENKGGVEDDENRENKGMGDSDDDYNEDDEDDHFYHLGERRLDTLG